MYRVYTAAAWQRVDQIRYNIVTRRDVYRWDLDWGINLLTTYKHDSELHTAAAPPLISTLYYSQQHPLSIFQPAMSSPAVR
jgi:hypothetical protein